MALARCEACGCPSCTKLSYPHRHKQLLNSGRPVFCGASQCLRHAEIWLTEEEEQRYFLGMRVFRLNHASEVRVM
jgi:hypothetical protein